MVSCPDVVNLSGGQISKTGNGVGSTTHFKCNNGLKLIGSNIRKCEIDGSWSGKQPKCKIICVIYVKNTHLSFKTLGSYYFNT